MASEPPPAKVRKLELTEDYSCGYCLQKLPYMTDPRELPCSHVFCQGCLQDEYTKSNAIRCTICGEEHGALEPASLPAAKLPSGFADTKEEGVIEEGISCDACKDCAVKFCTDCSKLLCEKHLQDHDNAQELFFRTPHQLIEVTTYKTAPRTYDAPLCAEHPGKVLILGCATCHQLLCERCPIDSGCTFREHSVNHLDKLGMQVRQRSSQLVEQLSDMINEVAKADKEVWVKLDDLEKKAKSLTEEVEKTVEDQIARKREDLLLLKTDIESNQRANTESVHAFVTGLEAKRGELNDLSRSTRLQLKEGHDAEIIKSFQSTKKQIAAVVQGDYRKCALARLSLDRTSEYGLQLLKYETEWSVPATEKERQQIIESRKVRRGRNNYYDADPNPVHYGAVRASTTSTFAISPARKRVFGEERAFKI